ncbi:MAG: DUF3048 domain-containing protein [Acidimicrobiales bacterium]|nr:DUF3048 domain-containing protein [Acidimicrobiales bacterium]
MRRLSALLLAIALVAALPTAGAGAQEDLPSSEGDLRELEETTTARIAELDAAIAAADGEIAALEPQVGAYPLRLELLADEYARAVEDRRAPALIFRQVSLDAFMRGDRALAGLIEQVASMRNDMSAVISQALYESVIEGAIADLEVVDARLLELGAAVEALRAEAAAAQSQLDDARARREQAIAERTELADRLERVERELVRFRYFESHQLLTGLPGGNPARPALAVKIDNVEAARPQSGINQADVVFEELVEGGVTRLAAVFHSTGSDPLGPVRSIRTTDVALLANLDRPLFSNSGGNAGAMDAVAGSTLVDVGHVREPAAYYRERTRRAPHNLFSSTETLWALHPDRTSPPPPLFTYRIEGDPLPSSAQPSEGVDIAFPNADISYRWDGAGWARTQNGRAHVDAAGVQVAPANVIVQFTEYGTSAADSRSPEGIVVGSGEALILTAGSLIRGSWSRENPEAPTVYTAGGQVVPLTPGRTWVALAPPGTVTVR